MTDSDEINLFGFKVHAIKSCCVFTYDGLGVNFKNKEQELNAAKALNDLLMPGGFIENSNIYTKTFEYILLERFGFKLVNENRYYDFILQKPF